MGRKKETHRDSTPLSFYQCTVLKQQFCSFIAKQHCSLWLWPLMPDGTEQSPQRSKEFNFELLEYYFRTALKDCRIYQEDGCCSRTVCADQRAKLLFAMTPTFYPISCSYMYDPHTFWKLMSSLNSGNLVKSLIFFFGGGDPGWIVWQGERCKISCFMF